MRCRHKNEQGTTSVEYALLVGLIAVVIIVSVGLFGNSIIALFDVPCDSLAAGAAC